MKNLDKTIESIGKIDGWLETNEIQVLYEVSIKACKEKKEKEYFVEIGNWMGKSTVTISLACKSTGKGVLYSIDPCKKTTAHKFLNVVNTEDILVQNLKKFRVKKFVKLIKKTSREAFDELGDIKTRLIFIDGDHDLEEISFDVNHWTQTLQEKGYLLLHDTLNHAGPRSIFWTLLRRGNYRYLYSCKDLSILQKMKNLCFFDKVRNLYSLLIYKLLFKFHLPAVS